MMEFLSGTWPWYVAGPLIGLLVPLLLLLGGKQFGVSSSLRHMCSAGFPGSVDYFRYDWKKIGSWNLSFVLGLALGGFLAVMLIPNPGPIGISEATKTDLTELGITNFSGLMPPLIFSWKGLTSLPGLIMIVGGGFFVGFGARYAGGCTSGHAITGLADLQWASLVAALGFFVGGLFVTYLVFPFLL